MPRLGTRPFFLGGSRKPAEYETLLEQDDCDIVKQGVDITMSLSNCPWTKRHTDLARRYRVNSVDIRDPSFGDRRTSDFLLDLPMLTSLSVFMWGPQIFPVCADF